MLGMISPLRPAWWGCVVVVVFKMVCFWPSLLKVWFFGGGNFKKRRPKATKHPHNNTPRHTWDNAGVAYFASTGVSIHGPARHWQFASGAAPNVILHKKLLHCHYPRCQFDDLWRGQGARARARKGRRTRGPDQNRQPPEEGPLVGDQEEQERREKEKRARQRGAWKWPHGAPPLSRMALGK